MTLDLETLFNTGDQKRFAFPGTLLWGKGVRHRLLDLIDDETVAELYVDIVFHEHELVHALCDRLGARLLHVEVIASTPKRQAVAAVAAKPQHPTLVIALGGGSTADFAKAVIAQRLYGTFDGVGMGDKRGLRPLADAVKPLLVSLPTTAGTGADASRYYVTYDAHTAAKTHGKAWRLIADWILVDAEFIKTSPDSLVVASAFDAFIHFFESYICRGEASWFGEMLSIDGITRVIGGLDAIVNRNERDEDRYLRLLYAATVAGMAISNVRTGNIHEAAGALLERSTLTHPETLMVFLPVAYAQYRAEIAEKERRLLASLAHAGFTFADFPALIAWWEALFAKVGLMKRIERGMAALTAPLDEVKAHIFQRVWSDRVWVEKESPRPLTERLVDDLIEESLNRFSTRG